MKVNCGKQRHGEETHFHLIAEVAYMWTFDTWRKDQGDNVVVCQQPWYESKLTLIKMHGL